MKKNNGFVLVAIILIILTGLAVGGGAFYYYENIQSEKEQNQAQNGIRQKEEVSAYFDISDFSVIDFDTCGTKSVPNVIKNQVREIEEEVVASGSMVKNTICQIDLDGNSVTQEYVLKSDGIGQNNDFYFYKIVGGQWKIILETNAAGVYISSKQKDGFQGILSSAHVSAGERYWELYEWTSGLKEYKSVKEWIENY